jgi:hypothetical protein
MKRIPIWGWIILFLIVVGSFIGGKVYVNNQRQLEMIQIVKSTEAQEIYSKELKVLDPNALSNDGVIQSYEVDQESVKANPMGGIMVNLIINSDKKLIVDFTLNKYGDSKLESGVGSESVALDKELEARYGSDD